MSPRRYQPVVAGSLAVGSTAAIGGGGGRSAARLDPTKRHATAMAPRPRKMVINVFLERRARRARQGKLCKFVLNAQLSRGTRSATSWEVRVLRQGSTTCERQAGRGIPPAQRSSLTSDRASLPMAASGREGFGRLL